MYMFFEPVSFLKKSINLFLYKKRFFKEKKYQVDYVVSVQNKNTKINKIFLILPVPSDTPHQSLMKNIEFFPHPTYLRQDNLYGNTYAVWEQNLLGGDTKIFKESFQIKITPNIKKKHYTIALNDYKKKFMNKPEVLPYLKANQYINGNSGKIVKIIHDINLKSFETFDEILEKINQYVIKKLKYGNPIKGLYGVQDALTQDRVDCGGFSTLFTSLCLSLNIISRLVNGYFIGFSKNIMHTWVEVYSSEKDWISIDPTIQHLMMYNKTNKYTSLGCTGSDRIIFSYGCDVPISIGEKNISVPILQNPIVIASDHEHIQLYYELRSQTL